MDVGTSVVKFSHSLFYSNVSVFLQSFKSLAYHTVQC